MKNVELSVEEVDPPEPIPDLPAAVSAALSGVGATGWDIALLLCSDARIRSLNREFRGIDEPTDVLSFSANSQPIEGDIVISLESVRRNADQLAIARDEELVRVAVHGALHLAGLEHDGITLEDPQARSHPMLSTQEEIVRSFMEEQ